MKNRTHHTDTGFTLIEILVVVAIMGILAAISIALYANYTTRARATDIITKYDAARSTSNANIAGETVLSSCDEVLKRFAAPTIDDDFARIAYAFEAVSNGNETGYRPVLTVCARVANQGAQGVKVARAAHDEFAKNTPIENGAVLTDTVVSFALPLTDPKRIVCQVPVGGPFTACGDPVAVPTPAKPPSQTPMVTPTPQAVQTPGPFTCPSGTDPVFWTNVATGQKNHACLPPCPSGQARDPNKNPLDCNPPVAANTPQASGSCPAGKEMVTITDGAATINGCRFLCLQGQQRDSAGACFTPPTCRGGQILSADRKSCACPAGQTMLSGRCAAPQPTAAQQPNTCLANCASISNPGHRHQCERGCTK